MPDVIYFSMSLLINIFFSNKNNCQKCCDYLNEKYGIIFKLMGD